ncbi:hypothetical protein [Embleya sp. NPDC050493]|uniref:hypothetical protein n=1 Tax=Embleya sp. NPDC050493 TaxID=3363989 RepID=UPI003795ECC7
MSVYEVTRRLPEISIVRDRSRAMAMLDAIMSPDWEFRFFSFDSHWSPTEEMASMRDGSGNEYSIVFSAAGAFARGFDHESPMAPYRDRPAAVWPGLMDTVPAVFRACVEEPAFCGADGTPRATVCLWRTHSDLSWRSGAVDFPSRDGGDADGAEQLFDVLADGRPEAYRRFAADYYEVAVDLEVVRHVYALRPLSQALVSSLNPEASVGELAEDMARIGYVRP